jgi:solute carrier family 13 (sodium-dependent dicarboxylate transporter), member 2/3/5
VLGPLLFLAVGWWLGGYPELSFAARWTGAVVALMATWWITEPVSLWATGCIPLIAYPLLGIGSLPVIALQYFDPVNFLFLGGMMIAASMQQWGLHRRIALGIIAVIGSSPRRIVLGFMLGTGFISMWISNTATTMMMFPIAMALVLKLSEQVPADDPLVKRFGLALMLGIAYAASIGGISTKIGTAPNIIMVKAAQDALGHELDFVTWLSIGLPLVLVTLPIVFIYLVRVAAPLPAAGFAGGGEAIAEERAGLGPMRPGERVAFVAFVSAALLWIFRKDIDLGFVTIPGWWDLITLSWDDVLGRPLDSLPAALAKKLGQDIGDAAVAMTIGLALLVIPLQLRPLRCALDAGRAARVPWGLLVLLGGGLTMAYGMQQSGLSNFLGSRLQGIGTVSPFVALLLMSFVSVAFTEVASNVATASILVPLAGAGAASLGLQPVPAMFAVALSASFGFMLPAGTPPNAIVYSSGYISVPQMVRAGIAVDMLGGVLVACLCYFLVPALLGLR